MSHSLGVRICALAGLLVLAGTGCARYVTLDPNGGVVAIPGNLPTYREEAVKLMEQRCPEGYEIVREEEVWRGEGQREWHIFFRSRNAEGEPLPSVGALPPPPAGSEALMMSRAYLPSVGVTYSSR